MPTYYTTTSRTAYPYQNSWTTSTTTDCSGVASWTYKKKVDAEYLKHWIESLKKPEVTEEDILDLLKDDD